MLDSRNMVWKTQQEKQLRLLTQFAPANAYEELIMWTEQGKHWKFPIDNETGKILTVLLKCILFNYIHE